MNTPVKVLVMAVTTFAVCFATFAAPANPKSRQPKRARPPKWSTDVLDTFFPNAHAKLVGSRPNYGEAIAATNANPVVTGAAAAPAETTRAGWSNFIDVETIETEIKRQAQEVAATVTTSAPFKGGAYKDCRREFSVLAALFAVIAEYDRDVRWKDAAAHLRDLFARAGRNCKVGTDQTFQEASQRKQDLADLISGNRPRTGEAEPKADWAQVADRAPLMQRLNIAERDRLQKWLATKTEFSARRDEVRHEAQLVAMMADIIGREGYEFADDDTYLAYARELKESASKLSAAVETANYEQALQAFGNMSKSCADCHDGYRQ